MPLVSVIVIFRNESKYLEKTIKSILSQSFTDFELIMIDDASTDDSDKIVKKFQDKRVRYFRNKKNMGIAYSRNRGIRNSNAKYIFFIDGDCIADKDWIRTGLKILDKGFIWVDGLIEYEDKNPQVSDNFIEKRDARFHSTGNIAFNKQIFSKVGLFLIPDEPLLFRGEDRDMGMRIEKFGIKPFFSRKMRVVHQKKKMNYKFLYHRSLVNVYTEIMLVKQHNDNNFRFGFFLFPTHLVYMIFPFLFFIGMLFKYRITSFYDIKMLFYRWVTFFRERYFIFKISRKLHVPVF